MTISPIPSMVMPLAGAKVSIHRPTAAEEMPTMVNASKTRMAVSKSNITVTAATSRRTEPNRVVGTAASVSKTTFKVEKRCPFASSVFRIRRRVISPISG